MAQALRPLVIIGAGGFGREVVDVVDAVNAGSPTFELLGFLDDGDVRRDLLERIGVPLLGHTSMLERLDAEYVIGIGAGDPRRRIDGLADVWGRRAAVLRHPAATVGRDVVLGDGAIIAAGARITTHIALGRHVHININCTIGHDTVVHDHATLFGGAVVGGGCTIGPGATVGSGAVILPGVRVGENAVVGAGAIVVRDVAPDGIVVAAAARPSLRSAQSDEPTRLPALPPSKASAS
jgi:sugar O-acyltransferase (sialic acid O-acetyltransferase NeuD family)